jgi:hypothetical protein
MIKRLGVMLLLVLSASSAAQTVGTVRPMVAPKVDAVAIDYRQQWEQERAKNQALRTEYAQLSQQLAEWTRRGGSQVHAYCETPTLSRNSAGASHDCAVAGFACAPVSGLCRTVANSAADCAGGHVYCATNRQCVRDANACP